MIKLFKIENTEHINVLHLIKIETDQRTYFEIENLIKKVTFLLEAKIISLSELNIHKILEDFKHYILFLKMILDVS